MRIILLIIGISLSFITYSQKDCDVKMDDLKGVYNGKCKNGLAHGKGKAFGKDTYSGKFKFGLPEGRGTYTYASGDEFIGVFKKGKRHGKGKYTFVLNGEEQVKEGFWEDDVYVGPKKIKPYKIIHKRSVERLNFYKTSDEGNDIKIEFLQNGRTNTSITELIVHGSSGNEQSISSYLSFKDVKFPFSGNLRYKSQNKLKTSTFDVFLEFEIIKPGSWKVTVYN